MGNELIRKVLTIVSSLAMLVQSLSPIAAIAPVMAPAPAYAQTATTTPAPTDTVTPTTTQTNTTPTDTPTVSPTPDTTVTPSPTDTTTPTVNPTDTATPTPSVTTTPTVSPTDTTTPTPSVTANPSQAPPTTSVSPTASASITPSTTPSISPSQNPSLNGTLNTTVLKHVSAPSLNLSSSTSYSSATITTNKSDYSPTDTVVISGSGFTPNTAYTLEIVSTDTPAVDFSTTITTDGNGSFVYAYQLDGNYRPNYTVYVNDGSTTVATTTFTDSPASGCENDQQGANDVPGQKDLTKSCVNYSNVPTSLNVSWNWDDTAWSGNNTGDACALFDTNGNGLANYALCVQVSGSPATYLDKFLYSCDDTSATNCDNATLLSPSNGTICSASISATDPFSTGDNYPNDTVANCTVALSDIGGSTSSLLDVCSYPSASRPSSASDCIVASTASQTGVLQVTKVLNPSTDSGLFNLLIDSNVYATDIGNNGTTGPKTVDVGDHTVAETQGTNTSLSDYSATIVCKDNGGAGSIVAQTSGSGPLTVNVTNNANILCTITNTRNSGSIELKKVWVGTGGQTTLNIGSTINGTDIASQQTGTAGATPLTTGAKTVNTGIYYVNEVGGLDNYTSALVCTDNGNATTVGTNNSVTVSSGHAIVCTFTNTRKTGTITVNKVINPSSDSGKFNLAVDGTIDATNVGNGGTTNAVTVDTGTNHSVAESAGIGTNLSNYSSTYSCSTNGSLPVTGNGTSISSISVNSGDSVVCTFTNTKLPTLTVIKSVTNDNGGILGPSAFTIHVSSGSGDVAGSPQPGSATGTTYTLNPGTYTVSENDPTSLGYSQTGITGDCSSNGSITLAAGDTKTCTITNNDVAPSLTLVKVVDNTSGGTAKASDFTLTATGPTTLSGNGTATSGATFSAGTYTLSESGPTGYQSTNGWSCTGGGTQNGNQITVGLGENVTCTITNSDIAPKITLLKQVNNTHGGTAVPTDFTLRVNGTAVTQGVAQTVTANANIQLSEDGKTGYTFDSITGDPKCPAALSSNFTLSPGDNITCTIVNDDVAPSLTLIKQVNNNNVGTASATAWTLTATGSLQNPTNLLGISGVTSGSNFMADTYSLAEANGPSGYSASSWSCTNGITVAGGNQITLGVGQSTTCTITNTAIAPQLTVIKHVINDNGGTLSANNFTMLVSATNPSQSFFAGSETGTTITLNPGSYSVGEVGNSGYAASYSSDCTGTIALGESKTCTVTNDDIAPNLTLIKQVVSGTDPATAWTLTATGSAQNPTDLSGTTPVVSTSTFKADTYTLGESGGPSGYSASDWVCSGNGTQTDGTHITLANNQSATCTITNTKLPTLTVTKILIPNTDAGKFNLLIDGTPYATNIGDGGSTGAQVVSIGKHTASETAGTATNLSDYNAVFGGDCDANGNVTLTAGQDAHCTITNTRYGSITVVKNTTGGDGTFTYSTTGTGLPSSFDVTTSGGTGSQTYSNLLPGAFSLSENVQNNWTLDSASCTDNATGGPVGTVTNGIPSFSLSAGQNVTCTFNNTGRGTLVIDKITNGGNDTFNFSVSGPTGSSQSVTTTSGSGTTGNISVVGGTYTVSENSLSGWTLSSSSCTDSKTSYATSNFTVPVGGTITCTFTNTRDTGSITVHKAIDSTGSGTFTTNDSLANTLGFAWSMDSGFANQFGVTVSGVTTLTSHAINEDLNSQPYHFVGWYDNAGQGSCTNPDGTTLPAAFSLTNAGDSKTITLCNQIDYATLIVHKVTNPANDPTNFTVTATGSGTVLNGSATRTDLVTNNDVTYRVTPGTFSVTEAAQANWNETNSTCTNISLVAGDTKDCTITNTENGTIIVHKMADTTGSGIYSTIDADANKLGFRWGFDATTSANNTNEFGSTDSVSVTPGDYSVYENSVAGYQFTGWIEGDQTDNTGYCGDVPHTTLPATMTVSAGETTEITLCNQQQTPILTITKANDTLGNSKHIGNSVMYTITLTATQAAAANVVLTDLLPKGFEYQDGSATIDTGDGPEPFTNFTDDYHSPGVWNIGTINLGQTITLTLVANITGIVDPGNYKDLAWAKGTAVGNASNVVYASANNPGYLGDPNFVGTDVTVVADNQTSTTLSPKQEVLGASTSILPETGANASWSEAGIMLMLLGFGLVAYGILTRKKKYEQNN